MLVLCCTTATIWLDWKAHKRDYWYWNCNWHWPEAYLDYRSISFLISWLRTLRNSPGRGCTDFKLARFSSFLYSPFRIPISWKPVFTILTLLLHSILPQLLSPDPKHVLSEEVSYQAYPKLLPSYPALRCA